MTIKSLWLRRIHKWVGLVIGLQFLLFAISGTAMALLPMDEVAGGQMSERSIPMPPQSDPTWPRVQRQLDGQAVNKMSLRALPTGQVFEIATPAGIRLFDARDGRPISIGRSMAASIAMAAHPEGAPVTQVVPIKEISLAVREHELPIWQVDFRDEKNSSYFVSGTTGEVLERRNDTWRWWDFFWMLHNMDYAERTSFNHPLIITVGFAMAWLAVTGFWLLFRTMWRHDFTWLKERARATGIQSDGVSATPR